MDEDQKKMAEELLFSELPKESFAKALFFGKFDAAGVFPFPKPTDEEEQRTESFLKDLTDYVDKHLDPDAIDRKAQIPKEVIKGLGKVGLLGMTVPEKYGGLGMSQNAYCRAIEVIARRCGGTTVFVNAHQSIGLKGILLFGTEEQKETFLPPLARGEKIAAFSLTEPNAGSDAGGVETTAEWDADKKVYRINGKKQWTTNGSIAGTLTVMAKTPVQTKEGIQEKVTAFLVTPDMPGFSVTNPGLEKVGIRGTRTTNLEFDNLEVPEKNILGPKGGGLRVCLTCLDYGRTTFGAMCTGAAKYCTRRAIDHAVSRYQFKQPLSSFPLVKEKLARMSALTYAMDATTYLTAGFIDAGVEDVMLESSILKVFASEALWQILYDTMQIFGGRSFFTSEPFERMMRDARLNMIGEGSNEVLRVFIGLVGMRDVGMELKSVGAAAKNPLGNLGQLWSLSSSLAGKLSAPAVPVRSRHLQNEAKALGQAIKRFSIVVMRLLAKYKEGIIDKQLPVNHIADYAIALYTASAVISKIDSDLADVNDEPSALRSDVSVAKLYCKMAFEKIESSVYALKYNFDEEVEAVADQITGIE